MQKSPSWEANQFSASQEIPRILWNPKVLYCVDKCPPPAPVLCQTMSYQNIRPCSRHMYPFRKTRPLFTVRSCWHLAQHPNRRTTPCRLSATAYSIHSQLPSILEAVPPFVTWGRAMPWWQGPTYHGIILDWYVLVNRAIYKSCRT